MVSHSLYKEILEFVKDSYICRDESTPSSVLPFRRDAHILINIFDNTRSQNKCPNYKAGFSSKRGVLKGNNLCVSYSCKGGRVYRTRTTPLLTLENGQHAQQQQQIHITGIKTINKEPTMRPAITAWLFCAYSAKSQQ